MSTTSEEVWQLLRELIAAQKENEREFQETRKLLQEQSQESDRQFQETRQLLKEQGQETERRFQQTDRKIQAVNQQIGFLGHRFGEFAEAQVRPAVVRLFQERGVEVERLISNLEVQTGQGGLEIDLLALNGRDVILVEIKSKLTKADVDEHLERLEKFKRFLPEYQNKRILGAVAGMIMAENVDRYAYRKGLFVLALSGDDVVILNDPEFQPQAW